MTNPEHNMFNIYDEHDGHKFEWICNLSPSSKKPGPSVTCNMCGGRCRPHFGMMDDPVDCYHCNNTGTMIDPNFVWKPTPPKELLDGLSKVWKDYWNKIENDKFTLT